MVKRLLTILMLGSLAMSANSQQLSNSTFDEEWVTCYPWYANKTDKEQGTTPNGWCISNVIGMNGQGATTVGEDVQGRLGNGKAVKLTNTPNPYMSSQIVPGYITLGTSWATAKVSLSLSGINVTNADGGVFGGIQLKKRPDAVRFYYKRTLTGNSTEKASVIAYSWKGQWEQQNVPSTTSMGTPTKVTMYDRDYNILGKDIIGKDPATGGTVSKTGQLIAHKIEYITSSTNEWTQYNLPLTYINTTEIPEKFNLIIAANDYFGSRDEIVNGNSITIDDVTLVYYHSLTSLSYGGIEIPQFSETTYSYDLSDQEYDADAELSYTKTGIASKVTTSYKEETGKLTITVTGDDGEETPYTIQFKVPEVSYTDKEYTETLNVDFSSVDPETGTATDFLTCFDPQEATVTVRDYNNRSFDFILPNFVLGVLPIGNIKVENLTKNQDGTFSTDSPVEVQITEGDDENISGWMGPMLPEVKVSLTGEFVGDKKIRVALDIDMSESLEQYIHVHLGYYRATMFISTTAKYATFIAPIEVNIPSGISAYEVTGVENGLLSLDNTNTSTVIPANVPVVLQSSNEFDPDDEIESENYVFYFTSNASADEYTSGLLTGVYKNKEITSGYVLQNLDNKVAFYLVDSEITVPANRCYLTLDNNAPGVKALAFPDGTLTSISEIQAADEKAVIYDLSGRRVSKATKGIYIINGKKVIK